MFKNKILNCLKIYIWWNFDIKKDEFHPSLNNMDNYYNTYIKREIAHLLDQDVKICDLPDHLIENFEKE